jgi:hypothetical protein
VRAFRPTLLRNKEQLEKLLEIELKLSEIEDIAILGSHPIVIAKKQ